MNTRWSYYRCTSVTFECQAMASTFFVLAALMVVSGCGKDGKDSETPKTGADQATQSRWELERHTPEKPDQRGDRLSYNLPKGWTNESYGARFSSAEKGPSGEADEWASISFSSGPTSYSGTSGVGSAIDVERPCGSLEYLEETSPGEKPWQRERDYDSYQEAMKNGRFAVRWLKPREPDRHGCIRLLGLTQHEDVLVECNIGFSIRGKVWPDDLKDHLTMMRQVCESVEVTRNPKRAKAFPKSTSDSDPKFLAFLSKLTKDPASVASGAEANWEVKDVHAMALISLRADPKGELGGAAVDFRPKDKTDTLLPYRLVPSTMVHLKCNVYDQVEELRDVSDGPYKGWRLEIQRTFSESAQVTDVWSFSLYEKARYDRDMRLSERKDCDEKKLREITSGTLAGK